MFRRYLEWRTRRAGPPVSLSVRAARYGALAFAIALAIMAVPVWQGTRDAVDAPPLNPDQPWEALRQMGRDMGAGA